MNIIKYLTSKKYRFFYKKYSDVQKAIWEQDFKIAKARQIREGVRQDRDRAVEAAGNLLKRVPANDDEKKNQEAQHLALTNDVARYERQMTMVDQQISGIPAEGENPGQEGIIDVIAGYAELRGMYKEFLAQI